MNREETFIKDLEDYLDTKFDRYSVNRIKGFLADYKASLPDVKVNTVFKDRVVVKNVYVDRNSKEEVEVPMNLTPQGVIEIVSEITDLPVKKIIFGNRYRETMIARHTSMFIIKNLFSSITLQCMGKLFGGKHHTTILHAITHVKEMIETNEEGYVSLIEKVNKRLSLMGEKKIA
jgi:chromosomal replication initiator protein